MRALANMPGAMEATALLQKVVGDIDVAIFDFVPGAYARDRRAGDRCRATIALSLALPA
ncbi:MAG: hypothetical protein ABJC09_08790 [Terriglobia bacterium]